jgi:hypothetical protein
MPIIYETCCVTITPQVTFLNEKSSCHVQKKSRRCLSRKLPPNGFTINPEGLMSKKYHTPAPHSNHIAETTIITNDLFLASFLHCVGCTLSRVERNERRRVSFVFTGERVCELRESYRSGKVSLDIKLFRDSMNLIRNRMDEAQHSPTGYKFYPPEERSIQHARTSSLTAQPLF